MQLEGEDENDGWGSRGKSRWILLFIFSLYLDTRAGKRENPSLEAPRMSDSYCFLFFSGLDIEAMYAIAASIVERILKNKQSPLTFRHHFHIPPGQVFHHVGLLVPDCHGALPSLFHRSTHRIYATFSVSNHAETSYVKMHITHLKSSS